LPYVCHEPRRQRDNSRTDLSAEERAVRLNVLSRVSVVSVPADVLADISDPASKVLIEVEKSNLETLRQKSTDRALAGATRADELNLLRAAHVTSNDIPSQKSPSAEEVRLPGTRNGWRPQINHGGSCPSAAAQSL
jgi:hypothetical protein